MIEAAVFGSVFVIIGVILIVRSVFVSRIMKDCREVSAVIVDLIEERRVNNGSHYTSYTPVYEYYDGELKQFTSTVSSNVHKSVGAEVTLYVSESGKVYEKRDFIITLAIGIIFTLVGALFAIVAFI